MTQKKRDSNIELLRIIVMILIMFHHFVNHSGLTFEPETINIQRFWVSLITMGGKLGVDVFVIISGYYLIEDKNDLSLRRVAKFWGQVAFYSIGMTAIYLIISNESLPIREIIYSFLPIASNRWWFASAYFVMYLVHPYINKLIHSMDKKENQKFVLFLVTLWIVMPLLFKDTYQMNEFIWFVVLYCIAGYIRLYGVSDRIKPKHYVFATIILVIVLYLLTILMMFAGMKSEYLFGRVYRYYEMKHPLTVMLALCLFMSFVNLKVPYNRVINTIASTTFGVYLIHDNELFRDIWWKQLFHGSEFINSVSLIPYSIFSVLILFIICSLIDYLRRLLFEKRFLTLTDCVIQKAERLFNQLRTTIENEHCRK